MPYRHGGTKIYPGDPQHGTRWATEEEKEMAGRALYDMETERNVIGLVPAPQPKFSGHKIRVQEQANPEWYRRFRLSYWRSRRSFQLKRWRVVKALKRVYEVGIVRRNGYETRLLKFLLAEGYHRTTAAQKAGVS
jgi:hypothetical protein